MNNELTHRRSQSVNGTSITTAVGLSISWQEKILEGASQGGCMTITVLRAIIARIGFLLEAVKSDRLDKVRGLLLEVDVLMAEEFDMPPLVIPANSEVGDNAPSGETVSA